MFDSSPLHQLSKFNNFYFCNPHLETRQPVLPYHTLSIFFVKAQRTVLKLSQLTIFFLVFKITNDAIAPLERDFLLKLGCVENLAVSKLTMQSLSHLLTQISNIGEMINLVKLIFFCKDILHKSMKTISERLRKVVIEGMASQLPSR